MAYAPPTLGGAEERRYPYLDQTLVEFLFSIPQSQLLRPGERRSLMRRALRVLLPPEVLLRRGKGRAARGFIVTLANKRADLDELFTDPLSSRLGFVNRSRFLDSLRTAVNGDAPHLVRLLKTVALESWLQGLLGRRVLQQCSEPHVQLDRSFAHRESQVARRPAIAGGGPYVQFNKKGGEKG
jgi:asparagine synthase (glutamine-hydrolysing)